MAGFTPDLFFRKLVKYGVTTFCAPPTVYRFLIRQDLSKYKLEHLRYCVTAGDAMNAEVFRIFQEKTGLEIHEGYGQMKQPSSQGLSPA